LFKGYNHHHIIIVVIVAFQGETHNHFPEDIHTYIHIMCMKRKSGKFMKMKAVYHLQVAAASTRKKLPKTHSVTNDCRNDLRAKSCWFVECYNGLMKIVAA